MKWGVAQDICILLYDIAIFFFFHFYTAIIYTKDTNGLIDE